MSTAIDTAKVTGRRELHFNSLDDILADVDRLAAAKEIRTLGNWSAGEIFKHVANVMNKSIDGFEFRPPWYIRFIVRTFMRSRFLTKPMTAGFKLPAGAQAELASPATTAEEGFQAIRQAIARLKTTETRVPSPVLGPLSRDEWTQLHCRHSELHLSFLIPVEG
jgi:hypothetical protein